VGGKLKVPSKNHRFLQNSIVSVDVSNYNYVNSTLHYKQDDEWTVRVLQHFKHTEKLCSNNNINKKAVLPQGNRAMPQVFFSIKVRQQHSLQV